MLANVQKRVLRIPTKNITATVSVDNNNTLTHSLLISQRARADDSSNHLANISQPASRWR